MVEVLFLGSLATPDHVYDEVVSRALVWVPGVVPAGLGPWALVGFEGLMVDAGPVFWAEAIEVLDTADVPVNVVEVRP